MYYLNLYMHWSCLSLEIYLNNTLLTFIVINVTLQPTVTFIFVFIISFLTLTFNLIDIVSNYIVVVVNSKVHRISGSSNNENGEGSK
jgi:predicted neutral ceramidase superfamily lipid hydrolase